MQKALFLYNPAAGRGRIARNVGGIVDIFSENGWELTPEKIDFGRNPFDAHPDIRMVVAAGGDGTVNYVVNRMRERGLSLELGIIPAGTANDFAGIVGMAKDPLEAARQIVTGEVQALDCGVVNGLHFVNIFSFGIFTTTSQRTPDERKHRLGKLAYIMEGIKELRHMHAIPLHVRTENGEFDFNALMALVFNGRRVPAGQHVERARRNIRLPAARKAQLPRILLRHGTLPLRRPSPQRPALARSDVADLLAHRRTHRRRRPAGRPLPARRALPARPAARGLPARRQKIIRPGLSRTERIRRRFPVNKFRIRSLIAVFCYLCRRFRQSMRRKTGYKILLAAMMALAIANVYVGKALDVHANDPLSRAECAASGSDATVEEYCLICHFHLAACTEAESFLPTLVTLFEERLYRCYLAGGSSPVLHGYGLRAPPAAV